MTTKLRFPDQQELNFCLQNHPYMNKYPRKNERKLVEAVGRYFAEQDLKPKDIDTKIKSSVHKWSKKSIIDPKEINRLEQNLAIAVKDCACRKKPPGCFNILEGFLVT